MMNKWNLLVVSVSLCFVSTTAVAKDDVAKEVLAVVNGTDITQKDYNAFAGIPGDEQKFSVNPEILKRLIDQELVLQKARQQGLDKDELFVQELGNMQRTALFNFGMAKFLEANAPSEKELKAAYEKHVKPVDEYHLKHIVVSSEAKARDIVKKLEKGEDFATLAKQESVDPISRLKGGDLGWLGKDQILRPIADKIDTFEKGKLSKEPVQTHVGWHVLLLQDVRKDVRPPMDQVRGILAEEIQAKKAMDHIAGLKDKAEIKIYSANTAKK